jgi:hypothetical protein
VHALSAGSGYLQFVVHAATPAGPTEDGSAVWSFGTGSTPNLFYVPLSGTGSRAIEVHCLTRLRLRDVDPPRRHLAAHGQLARVAIRVG